MRTLGTPPNEVRIYTAVEAAAVLGINPITLRTRARTQKIGERNGRDWVFTQADLEKLRPPPRRGRPRQLLVG